MALRILLVANTLPPTDISGVGEQVVQLATGLAEAGHEVEILGRGRGGARGPKLLFPLTAVPAFLRVRRRFKPDIVQVHESDGVGVALWTAVLRGLWHPIPQLVALLQVSYLEEIRAVRPLRSGGEVLGRPGGVERRFRWLKAPLHVVLGWLTTWCADAVLTPSARTGREVVRDYAAEEVLVLPNVKAAVSRDSGFEKDETTATEDGYFLFVGRLRIRKGVEVLLAALRSLAAGGQPARLVIVGDGEHRVALERAATRFGVEGAVEFVGRRDGAEVRTLLRQCRALVVPSTYEGMPLVILEAMEEGIPVIASSVSGIPEVVSDRVTGWLVPPEDPEALAGALAQALVEPEEARRRGEAGRMRLEEHYRPRNAVDLWQERVGILVRTENKAVEELDG